MILEIRNIKKYFKVERGLFKTEGGLVKALDGVSFDVEEFQTLGIVGESGCGKTTLAKIILGLIPSSSGEIAFDNKKISNFRKDVQIVFQNPYNSLDPKMRVKDLIIEPVIINRLLEKNALNGRVRDLIKTVGLDESVLDRYPIEFSGGQRQRICIARALASEPKFLVLDEPISSLDLIIQAEMLDLFLKLKERLKLTYIFITHNLAVIKHIADLVVVMRNGTVVEQGGVEDIFVNPKHKYTQGLIEIARG